MVRIENLSFSYSDGEEELFSSLSLSIKDSEIVLLVSPSGSGKSTLSKIITGGVPKYSGGKLSGHIYVDDVDILSLDIPERIKYVARVSQNTDEMLLFPTVEAELSFPLENLGYRRELIEKKVDEILSLFELEQYKEVSTTELSGGEKRRLMCAILFLVSPSFFILDESFDELSPSWREKLLFLIKESGKTALVLGSHFLSEYASLTDNVVSIKNGKIVPYEDEAVFPLSLEIKGQEEKLEVDNLSLSLRHRAIKEDKPFFISMSSFSLSKGALQILMGDNGAGKSTFAKLLCGLSKPDSGDIFISGKLSDEKERRVKVAYLMQNPFEQLFLPTVYDELKSTGASDDDINNALQLFSLKGDWYISEISYGRAKLVQSAVFYLLDREYAILDELDSAISYDDSLKVVKAYLDKGMGVLTITHDERFVSLLNAPVVFLKEGRLCR